MTSAGTRFFVSRGGGDEFLPSSPPSQLGRPGGGILASTYMRAKGEEDGALFSLSHCHSLGCPGSAHPFFFLPFRSPRQLFCSTPVTISSLLG